MKEPKLNVRLLRKVQKAILKHADQFAMSDWDTRILDDAKRATPGGCGTAACIGGWAILIHRGYKKASRLERLRNTQLWAHQVLGLDPYDEAPLFFLEDWPLNFRTAWDKSKTSKQQARIAVKRIDHFIKTGL